MPKYNRGNTIKLSIRLSTIARQKLDQVAKNLGISSGGLLLFELTKILKNPPSLNKFEDYEREITLEREHFVVTVNEPFMDRINKLAEDYGIKKNVLIGYIVSDHFQRIGDPVNEDDLESKKLMIQVNENLKKKMMDYSEENYIPLSGLVSYSILNGPYEGLPSYGEGEAVQIFTSVPGYIGELVKTKAAELNVREHFYTSLCLYKQFMIPEGRFFE